jgi:hypothetical protein
LPREPAYAINKPMCGQFRIVTILEEIYLQVNKDIDSRMCSVCICELTIILVTSLLSFTLLRHGHKNIMEVGRAFLSLMQPVMETWTESRQLARGSHMCSLEYQNTSNVWLEISREMSCHYSGNYRKMSTVFLCRYHFPPSKDAAILVAAILEIWRRRQHMRAKPWIRTRYRGNRTTRKVLRVPPPLAHQLTETPNQRESRHPANCGIGTDGKVGDGGRGL